MCCGAAIGVACVCVWSCEVDADVKTAIGDGLARSCQVDVNVKEAIGEVAVRLVVGADGPAAVEDLAERFVQPE